MVDNEDRISSFNTMEIATSSRRKRYYEVVKRGIDIVGSMIGLFFFIITYIILFIPYHFGENKGSVLFKQQRLGKNGEIFEIFKFRSMKTNADDILKNDQYLYKKYVSNGYKLEVQEDPRITKLGCFIRKYSIDELPQFLNVLIGEMSLVGPRPIVLDELEEYKKENEVKAFLSMKPGLTGVWQVSGRSSVGYPERVYLETSYLNKQSLSFDLKVLFLTAVKVLKKDGAY
ncbi:sugar transferase [Enterococcus sp.]|uniref:sugar transferase n=1 Tax=Enterococcus sp. TaxID=35783 RepID=UPI0029082098|nr:sugar transferase [Enterococcus sp.]MDU5333103.1 sugar transferase [Enterococcus sp.]